ncbi:MAG: hypothetical protein ACLGQH_13535 [Acidobacteriota bacterium]
MDSGAVNAAEIHEADQGDTKALGKTLQAAAENLKQLTSTPPRTDDPADLVADKGCFFREALKELEAALGEAALPKPNDKVSTPGMAIAKHGAPCTTIGFASAHWLANVWGGNEPNCQNAALNTPLIAGVS